MCRRSMSWPPPAQAPLKLPRFAFFLNAPSPHIPSFLFFCPSLDQAHYRLPSLISNRPAASSACCLHGLLLLIRRLGAHFGPPFQPADKPQSAGAALRLPARQIPTQERFLSALS
ncbi:hypothetical protein CCHR01_12899 [Colletotrichum chrysophilum]|uniref:Uncharacterized protein n=1 Tax=Colletotrichum chrysophilum TaxID=1836956 RepID=A0AAD9EH08_9PEZI|nr:hypothetical protein CCHR01_12899 [Colletotrichum chrysophilum]